MKNTIIHLITRVFSILLIFVVGCYFYTYYLSRDRHGILFIGIMFISIIINCIGLIIDAIILYYKKKYVEIIINLIIIFLLFALMYFDIFAVFYFLELFKNIL